MAHMLATLTFDAPDEYFFNAETALNKIAIVSAVVCAMLIVSLVFAVKSADTASH